MQIIRSFVRFILLFLRRVIQALRWKRQYNFIMNSNKMTRVLKKERRKPVSCLSLPIFKDVLVLAPHADDELIGCSSFLLNNRIKSSVLYFELFGHNTTEKNKEIRNNEIINLSKEIGFDLFMELDCKEWLRERLIKKEYDAILIPCPFDWHWEHRLVFCRIAEVLESLAVEELPLLLLYSISVPLLSGENTYGAIIGKKGQKDKWTLFSNYYLSQKMPILRFRLQEKLNNHGIASELFRRVSKSDIISIHQKLLHDNQFVSELDSLQGDINDIKKIRLRIASLIPDGS